MTSIHNGFVGTFTFCVLLWIAAAAAAEGPTSLDLQRRLAAGSNSGVANFTSVTAAAIFGDLSGATVRPSGSTTGRTMSDEFSDQVTVRNFGSIGDGQHDDSAAFQAAEESARYSGTRGRTVFVNPGNYMLNSTIYSVSGNAWMIPAGASFTGGGVIAGSTDNDALRGNTGLSLLKLSAEVGNANTLFVSNVIDTTTSATGYQKNGIYSRVSQKDRSSSQINRDAVSLYADGDIATGNTRGRVWGVDATVLLPNGSDGYGVGLEIGVNNFTGTTGNYGEYNSKFGINIFAGGSSNSTAAMDIQGAGAKWLDGILMFQSAIVNDAFTLRNNSQQAVAAIHQDGSALFSKVTSSGPIITSSTLQLASYTFSILPLSCATGQEVFVTDGRNPGESAGNGSGTPAFCNNKLKWYAVSTGAAVTN